MTDGIADLAIDERVKLRDALALGREALIGSLAQGRDGPGAVAVALGQVLGDLGLDAKVLDQVDEEGAAEAVGADQADAVRLAGAVEDGLVFDVLGAADQGRVGDGLDGQVKLLDGGVDALLGHLAVGGPLAAGASDESGGRNVDQVVAHEGLGVLGLGVADQRAETGPGGQDVAAADVDVGGQVVADLVENPLDRLLIGQGVLGHGRGLVGGTGDGVALPGEEEDDAAVGGGRVDQAHLAGAVVAGEDNVHTGGGSDNVLAVLVVHLADGVGEGTGAVDDALGLDVKGARLVSVSLGDHVLEGSTAELAVRALLEGSDLHVVHNSSTVEGGSHADRDVHAGVVVGTVVVDESANKVGLLEHGEGINSLALGQKVGALDALGTSQEIVELGACPVVRNLPPLVERQHDG